MVMAETQKSPESVRPTSACAPTGPPGLRRLRFPFFDLLVKELWSETASNGPAWRRPAAAKTKPITRFPREASCSIRRLPAHCRAPVHGSQTPLISLTADPCQRVGEEFLHARTSAAGFGLPQNGPHCFAHTPRGPTTNPLLHLFAYQLARASVGSTAASLTSAGAARNVVILSARH
jgi:hypothetical protein